MMRSSIYLKIVYGTIINKSKQDTLSDNNDDSTDASLSNWLKFHQQTNINVS